jgi:hypothetical protein
MSPKKQVTFNQFLADLGVNYPGVTLCVQSTKDGPANAAGVRATHNPAQLNPASFIFDKK